MTRQRVRGSRLLIAASFGAMTIATAAAGQTVPPQTTLPPAIDPAPVASEAPAAQDQPQQYGELQDIVVTAQKRSERINDVPLAITAATGEQLRNAGISDIQDLVKITPGLQFSQTGVSAVYTLRGIGFYDTTLAARGAVAVYVDEVSLPFAVMSPVAPFDLERVEVLKGPQGTLFGQNSTGGAINYIAAKPTKTLSAGITASIGRFGRGETEVFVSGPLSSTLTVRVATKIQYGGDWQRSYTRNTDSTLGSRSAVSSRLLVQWEPLQTFRVNVNLTNYRNRSDPQAPQYLGTSPLFSSAAFPPNVILDPRINPYTAAPHNNRAADWDPGINQFVHDDLIFGSVRVEGDINSDTTLTLLGSYADYRKRAFRDTDGVALLNGQFGYRGHIQVFQQEARVNGKIGHGIRYVVGANYEFDKAYETNNFVFGPTTSVAAFYQRSFGRAFLGSSDYTDVRYESVSGFANIDVDLTNRLTARGGIRYTTLDGQGRGCLLATDPLDIVRIVQAGTINRNRAALGLAPITIDRGQCYTSDGITPGEARPTLNENNVSWRGVLDWKPTNTTLLYGSVSKGYKSGSFPTVPGTNTAQFNAASQESVLAYELGAKVSLLDRRVQINGAVFYYDYTDKQFLGRTVTLTGVAPVLVNVPSSRVKGAELQIDVSPVDGLRLTAAGTYLDTRIGAFTNFDAFGVSHNFEGDRFPFAPKFQATLDGEYDFRLKGSLGAFIGGNVVYQSSTNAGFGGIALLAIKSYGTADLRFGIENKDARWRLSAYVRNLTDEYYWNNAVRVADTVVRYTGLPRTYGLTASLRM